MAKIGLIHYNLRSLSFEEFLDYSVKTGFEYCELQLSDVWTDQIPNPEARAEEVRRMMDQRRLKVSALSAGNDFVLLDKAKIEAQVARMKRICGLARILGTHTIRTEGGQPKPEVPPDKYAEAIAGCLQRCLEFGEAMDMYFAVDNHGYVTNDGDLEAEIFERVNNPHVGANIDTMNYRWAGHDLAKIDAWYQKLARWCLHTHMKDGTGSLKNYVGAALGEGEIHLEHAVACLRQAGYQGVWCAEYEGREDPLIGYAKCGRWLKEHL